MEMVEGGTRAEVASVLSEKLPAELSDPRARRARLSDFNDKYHINSSLEIARPRTSRNGILIASRRRLNRRLRALHRHSPPPRPPIPAQDAATHASTRPTPTSRRPCR